MKLSELPDDTNMLAHKLRLPDDVFKKMKAYAGAEREMYPAGPTHGAFFMSPDPLDAKSRRLYPLPEYMDPLLLLEWEVVQ